MKAVVAAFNQEKALVGAFSVIVQLQLQHRVHQGDGDHRSPAALATLGALANHASHKQCEQFERMTSWQHVFLLDFLLNMFCIICTMFPECRERDCRALLHPDGAAVRGRGRGGHQHSGPGAAVQGDVRELLRDAWRRARRRHGVRQGPRHPLRGPQLRPRGRREDVPRQGPQLSGGVTTDEAEVVVICSCHQVKMDNFSLTRGVRNVYG